MSVVDDIVKAVSKNLKSQGYEGEISQLTPRWDLAEKYLTEFLIGSYLLGLNKWPTGYGNLLLFSRDQDYENAHMQLEVGGSWAWINSPISTIIIKDDEPFQRQEHAILISKSNAHVGSQITAFKIWKPLPHIAIEFSDDSLLVIHCDAAPYESWGFRKYSPDSFDIIALPGGPIAVV
jgi:hypothetical protein